MTSTTGAPTTTAGAGVGVAPAAGAGANPSSPSGSAGSKSGNAANPVIMTTPSGGNGSVPPSGMLPTVRPTRMTRDPVAIDECGTDNAAGLSAADVTKLRAGSAGAGMLRTLYPYDGTVFPRGLLAPDLMWDGATADAVFVHIHGKAFDYTGCLKPTAAGRVALPQTAWDTAGAQTYGKEESFTLDLSVIDGGNVTGPATIHFQIAQATIKGSIYYNSYSSMLGVGMCQAGVKVGAELDDVKGGLVLRIPPGKPAELFGRTGCNGCHSVSTDGSRLLSQFVTTGRTYELTGTSNTSEAVPASMRAAFGALYPDGSAYLSMSSVIEVARTNNATSTVLPVDAALYDATNGAPIASKGIPPGVLMPAFSPDGTYLAFNDYAIDQAHGLALMKYDVKAHAATEYKMLVQEPAGATRPGWPFVLPDNHAVVFVRTDGEDFSGNGAGVTAACPNQQRRIMVPTPTSELSMVDVASGTVTLLARAMGYATPADATSGKTYLPFGSEELHHSYFPTLSPVAAGGYFWVFFDSLRHYGNMGLQRQLWGTAIDISPDGTYTIDLSHPAFFLPGQEIGTGNHRAFAALDPCRNDGESCTSGIDCCNGHCDIPDGALTGVCGPRKRGCSLRDEQCETVQNCCAPAQGEPAIACIASFCADVPELF